MHHIVYAQLRDVYFEKIVYFRNNKNFALYSHYDRHLRFKKKLCRREYTWKRFDRTAYLTANYSCISPNCSFVPLPSPQSTPQRLSNVQRFNGPPRPKTPGKIIQISSLRFSSNPSERGGSARVDAQHTGCLGDSRAN